MSNQPCRNCGVVYGEFCATLPAAPAPTEQAMEVPHEHTEDEDCNCEAVGYAKGWNAALAARQAPSELRDTLIQLATVQRQLIDANAEIAALLMGVHPEGRRAPDSRDAVLLTAAEGYIAALDAWENTNKAERRVKTAEAVLREAIAQEKAQ